MHYSRSKMDYYLIKALFVAAAITIVTVWLLLATAVDMRQHIQAPEGSDETTTEVLPAKPVGDKQDVSEKPCYYGANPWYEGHPFYVPR